MKKKILLIFISGVYLSNIQQNQTEIWTKCFRTWWANLKGRWRKRFICHLACWCQRLSSAAQMGTDSASSGYLKFLTKTTQKMAATASSKLNQRRTPSAAHWLQTLGGNKILVSCRITFSFYIWQAVLWIRFPVWTPDPHWFGFPGSGSKPVFGMQIRIRIQEHGIEVKSWMQIRIHSDTNANPQHCWQLSFNNFKNGKSCPTFHVIPTSILKLYQPKTKKMNFKCLKRPVPIYLKSLKIFFTFILKLL